MKKKILNSTKKPKKSKLGNKGAKELKQATLQVRFKTEVDFKLTGKY